MALPPNTMHCCTLPPPPPPRNQEGRPNMFRRLSLACVDRGFHVLLFRSSLRCGRCETHVIAAGIRRHVQTSGRLPSSHLKPAVVYTVLQTILMSFKFNASANSQKNDVTACLFAHRPDSLLSRATVAKTHPGHQLLSRFSSYVRTAVLSPYLRQQTRMHLSSAFGDPSSSLLLALCARRASLRVPSLRMHSFFLLRHACDNDCQRMICSLGLSSVPSYQRALWLMTLGNSTFCLLASAELTLTLVLS